MARDAAASKGRRPCVVRCTYRATEASSWVITTMESMRGALQEQQQQRQQQPIVGRSEIVFKNLVFQSAGGSLLLL